MKSLLTEASRGLPSDNLGLLGTLYTSRVGTSMLCKTEMGPAV